MTLRGPSVAWELPKRHSLRCREAIADLGRRKVGRKEEAVLIDRRSVERVPARRFEQPASLLERRLARFDSLLEPIVGIESEYGQPGQPHPLLFAAGGIDDGITIAVHLIDPEAGRVLYAASGSGAEQLRLHPFGELAQVGGNRVVSDGCKDSEQIGRASCRERV